MKYPFTEQEMAAASAEWGCNCGPSALAFAVQQPLDVARFAIPEFEKKRFTSPMMMKAGLEFLKRRWAAAKPPRFVRDYKIDVEAMFVELPALVRVQWDGPWCDPGMNPRWAYRYTHWICTWMDHGVPFVFDCNGGIRGIGSWEDEIVPLLACMPRANGEWFPTHIWRLLPPTL